MTLPIDLDGMTILKAGAALAATLWVGRDLFRDRFFHHETDTAYGAASWAKSRDLKKAGLFGPEGIVLGRFRGKLLRHRTDKHLLTLAPNRAGKGVSAIIPNLLTWPGSVLVIDPKGENAVVTARRRQAMGQAVHVLDPWGITGLARASFNPLLALAPDSADLAGCCRGSGWNCRDGVSGGLRLPAQAARSMTASVGLVASVCQPSTLRMVI